MEPLPTREARGATPDEGSQGATPNEMGRGATADEGPGGPLQRLLGFNMGLWRRE